MGSQLPDQGLKLLPLHWEVKSKPLDQQSSPHGTLLRDQFTAVPQQRGLPGGPDGKESACNVGDLGLIPGLGRAPGEGQGSPLQCSCLENAMDGGAWRATVIGFAE